MGGIVKFIGPRGPSPGVGDQHVFVGHTFDLIGAWRKAYRPKVDKLVAVAAGKGDHVAAAAIGPCRADYRTRQRGGSNLNAFDGLAFWAQDPSADYVHRLGAETRDREQAEQETHGRS